MRGESNTDCFPDLFSVSFGQTHYEVLKRSSEPTYIKSQSSYGFWYRWFLEIFEIDEAQVNFSALVFQRSWTEMLFQLMKFKS